MFPGKKPAELLNLTVEFAACSLIKAKHASMPLLRADSGRSSPDRLLMTWGVGMATTTVASVYKSSGFRSVEESTYCLLIPEPLALDTEEMFLSFMGVTG